MKQKVYSRIKCSKCGAEVLHFWSDLISYEAEIEGKECAPQLCDECARPLTKEELEMAHNYLKSKWWDLEQRGI